MCMKRYLLLEDGLAPGISEKHSRDLMMWLGKHPAIGHLFCASSCECVSHQVYCVLDSHLIYNQATSLQQESPSLQEKIIISNIPNTRVVGRYVFFPFPAFSPGNQLWIKGNKSISFLNIHHSGLQEPWRQTAGVPASGLALHNAQKEKCSDEKCSLNSPSLSQ